MINLDPTSADYAKEVEYKFYGKINAVLGLIPFLALLLMIYNKFLCFTRKFDIYTINNTFIITFMWYLSSFIIGMPAFLTKTHSDAGAYNPQERALFFIVYGHSSNDTP